MDAVVEHAGIKTFHLRQWRRAVGNGAEIADVVVTKAVSSGAYRSDDALKIGTLCLSASSTILRASATEQANGLSRNWQPGSRNGFARSRWTPPSSDPPDAVHLADQVGRLSTSGTPRFSIAFL